MSIPDMHVTIRIHKYLQRRKHYTCFHHQQDRSDAVGPMRFAMMRNTRVIEMEMLKRLSDRLIRNPVMSTSRNSMVGGQLLPVQEKKHLPLA
jgi:hypothetical protein